MSALRDALAAKQVLTTHYDIPIKPRPVVDEIIGRLEEARRELLMANNSQSSPGTRAAKRVRDAEAQVAKVKTELDACFYRLHFRALKDDADMDALMLAHPPTEAQKAKNPDAKVDPDPYYVALLTACAVGSDLTEEEWQAELWSERWTEADRWNINGTGIFNKVDEANQRGFNDGIPFG